MNINKLPLDEQKRLLVSIRRLRGNPDFINILEHLQSELNDRDKELRSAKDNFQSIQGAAKTLESILSTVENCSDTWREISNQESMGNTGF
jgi:hypothetical protein